MRLTKKLIISFMVYVLWISIEIIPSIIMMSYHSDLCDVLVSPLMVGVIYPAVSIALIILTYKIKPLEKTIDKKRYIIANCILSFLVLLWSMPYAILHFINDVLV